MERISDIVDRVMTKLTKEVGAMETPETILDQLEEVRASGRCNMFGRLDVQVVANDLELYELVVWLNEVDGRTYMAALQNMKRVEVD